MIDLHIHTTASDGLLSPREAVRYAGECGVDCVAITDHNVFLSRQEAAALSEEFGVNVIPGAEISSLYGQREMHILAYGTLPEDSELAEAMRKTLQQRRERAVKIAAKLREYGIFLNEEELMACKGGVPGRMHIARQMVAQGYCATTREAFERYIGIGNPAYIPCQYLSAVQAVSLTRAAGLVPVLAHPMRYHAEQPKLFSIIRSLADAGLQGVEVYYPAHRAMEVRFLKRCCRRFGLTPTAGSDFHGRDHHWSRIGVPFSLSSEEERVMRAFVGGTGMQ